MARVDDIKSYLGLNASDTSQDGIILAASLSAEAEIAEALDLDSLSEATYTEKYDVEEAGQDTLRLRRWANSITSVTNGDTAIIADDYYVRADRWLCLIARAAEFAYGRQSVTVEYLSGFAAIPADLDQAITLLAVDIMKKTDDKQSETIGAYSYKKFERGDQGDFGGWPPIVYRIVSRYMAVIPGRTY
jgi:hypothetical protein